MKRFIVVCGLIALVFEATHDGTAATNGPSIAMNREGSQVRILYYGILQSAPGVTGPWVDVAGAGNPYVQDLIGDARFYRSRETEGIFGSTSVVNLTFTAPLQEHFELAFAGMPDGINPPIRLKPYFDGTVMIDGNDISIAMKVRGNSSLQECPFPKLKFKVSRTDREGTPFFDAREVDIATHCAEGGRGSIGRLRDQIATYREALAYEAMATLGFITPRVRRAQIEYRDSSPPKEESETGWVLSRQALILDDIEVVAEGLGGRALDDEEIAVLTDANFDEQLVTELWMFHALLGNWDYVVQTDGRSIWNTDVIVMATGEMIPVAGDFDLSSWVTEEVSLTAPWDYFPEMPDVEREARYRLEGIQKSVSLETFTAAATRFIEKRQALTALVNDAQLDPVGRTNALRHMTAFYDGLEAVTRK